MMKLNELSNKTIYMFKAEVHERRHARVDGLDICDEA